MFGSSRNVFVLDNLNNKLFNFLILFIIINLIRNLFMIQLFFYDYFTIYTIYIF
ncbi:hypothetical protein X275_08655 [Marinitoga sp. 1197]|nr:hypothetical protein X275_08655 [Marinitoga sp. 1197]